MDERRRHVRFPSTTILQYKDALFAAHNDAVTKDVSLGGACFFSEKKIKLGRMIKLKLFYDAKSPAKIMKGKVVWSRESREQSGKGYLNGVIFLR